MENKFIPDLRFSGFDDGWKINKLDEIAEKISVGIATSSSGYFTDKNKGVPFIKNQNIKQNRIDDKELEYISPEFDRANINKRVREGDILTARTGYPGLSAVVPPYLNGAQTFTTLITRLKTQYAFPEFVANYINSEVGMRQITGMEAGGAQRNVNAGILKSLNVPLPSLEEQRLVSTFIKFFDMRISISKQELETLKQTKQGFLQKMFPKEGETAPEIRFSGFNKEWTKHKVSELFKVTRGQVLATSKTSEKYSAETPYPVYSSQTKNKGLMGYYNQYLFDTAITWTTDGANAGTVNFRKGKFYSTNVNGVLISEQGYANKAVAEALNLIAWKYVSKVGNPKLMNNVMGEIYIMIPGEIEELNEISNFFEKLDQTIELHEKELEALKQTKKAFLQKMFV